jgi:hypothetical protein
MPKVLTTGSTLKCLHQGTVQLVASQQQLKVDGQAVLVEGDLDGAAIQGCVTPNAPAATPPTKPCMTVVSMASGAASKLKVGGKAVLLETAAGMTDGILPAPTNLWNVASAGQTKLDTL